MSGPLSFRRLVAVTIAVTATGGIVRAALPALDPLTREERPPCSRVRLEKLLEMLEPEDAEQLETLERIMFFDRLSFDLTDKEIVDFAGAGGDDFYFSIEGLIQE